MKIKQLKSINTDQKPTVKRLINYFEPVYEHTSCLRVLDIFAQNTEILALSVISNKNIPLGIIERHPFLETFLKPYKRKIYAEKNITEFMDINPITVDINSTLDDFSEVIFNADLSHMVNGFVITENGIYAGIAYKNDLLYEITKTKKEDLFYISHYDQLTKLPNRFVFMDRLSISLIKANRNKSKVGLLYIDLDSFKHYNDSMGHAFGDQILVAFAERLKNFIRETDTVARLSGDEFTILLEDIISQDNIDIFCQRIMKAMEPPWLIMGRTIYLTASIGSAIYPQDSQEINNLLLKADSAMYEAKRSGRNTFKHYEEGMFTYSQDNMSIETDLYLAIERDEFELYYQPQVEIKNEKIVGVEALIRWNHPERGIVTPIHFIEIAEKSGRIVQIGKWVLKEACRQFLDWKERDIHPLRMSVNIAPMQFYQPDFCETIRTLLEETGMQASSLELELTEGTFIHNLEKAVLVLTELHALGVKLSIDDFGTGYSNLGYLKRFPIDRLKIDQSFVRGVENEPVNLEIIRSLAALANILSLELVAEGVETEIEMEMVSLLGCGVVQGYKYSKPIPALKFEEWYAENKMKS